MLRVIKRGISRYTCPCWLLVTLRLCVTDPFPLAGTVLLLAGSKRNWMNWNTDLDN
jgi:hypothetical protein